MLWVKRWPDNPRWVTVAAMAIAIREKLTEKSQQFLQAGEQVQAVIVAQTASGWLATVPILSLALNKYAPIIVTDRRILVLDSGRWSMGNPKSISREFPRSTTIGPPSGLWWQCTTLGDKLYVHKRFHKDVEAADALRR